MEQYRNQVIILNCSWKKHKIDINECYYKNIITLTNNMKFIIGMGDRSKLKLFCQFIENIRTICEFITFHFEKERLYSQGMSEDHSAIFELLIVRDWFEFYDKEEGDTTVITIRTAILSKILETRQKSQFLVLEYNGNPSKLNISLKNKPKDEISDEYPKEFEVPLISVDSEILTIPETEYNVDFNIGSMNIRTIVEQLMLFDQVINIKCNENTLEFSSNGEDGSLKINLFDENDKYVDEYAIEEDYNFDSSFNAKHLHAFCKFNKLSKTVCLGLTNEFPMSFEYRMDNNEQFKVRFLLAPRMKDDE